MVGVLVVRQSDGNDVAIRHGAIRLPGIKGAERGEQIPRQLMPALQAGETLGEKRADVLGGTGLVIGLLEETLPGFEAGAQALLHEAADESAQFDGRPAGPDRRHTKRP